MDLYDRSQIVSVGRLDGQQKVSKWNGGDSRSLHKKRKNTVIDGGGVEDAGSFISF